MCSWSNEFRFVRRPRLVALVGAAFLYVCRVRVRQPGQADGARGSGGAAQGTAGTGATGRGRLGLRLCLRGNRWRDRDRRHQRRRGPRRLPAGGWGGRPRNRS